MVGSALLLLLLAPLAAAVAVHSLHWNSSNPIFRIDNTDHIVDVNSGNLPWEYDQLNLVCPVGRGGTRGAGRGRGGEGEGERYIIYNVSKEEYDSCRISQAEPRVVAVCDKPERRLQFTITFRSFSPTPRGLEFRPGQDYYFISTSSRRDLHRRAGGSCAEHNMRVIFKVAAAGGQEEEQRQPAINRPRAALPEEAVRPVDRLAGYRTQVSGQRSEVVKQEASTMSAASALAASLGMAVMAALVARTL